MFLRNGLAADIIPLTPFCTHTHTHTHTHCCSCTPLNNYSFHKFLSSLSGIHTSKSNLGIKLYFGNL